MMIPWGEFLMLLGATIPATIFMSVVGDWWRERKARPAREKAAAEAAAKAIVAKAARKGARAAKKAAAERPKGPPKLRIVK